MGWGGCLFVFYLFLWFSVVSYGSHVPAFEGVLGKLGPGQSGPGQLGPGQLGLGQLGPGAQLSGAQFATDNWAPDIWAQFATFSGWTVGN